MEARGQRCVERRLAAILAADVAGYSRLMGADEAGTAQALARASHRRRSARRRAWRADRQDDRRRGADRVRLGGRRRRVRLGIATADGGAQCRNCRRAPNGMAHRHPSRRCFGRGGGHPRRRCQHRGTARRYCRTRRHLHFRRRFPPSARQSRSRVYRYRRAEPQEHYPTIAGLSCRPVNNVPTGGASAAACRCPTSRRSRYCRSPI